jgi:hypothetical protein
MEGRMALTAAPSGLGRVRGAIIRARTLTNGVYDVVVGERGIVLVPLWVPEMPRAAALLVSGFQGGVFGHFRGGEGDARRRMHYLATTADELALHYFSNLTVRRQDVKRVHVWDHHGSGKLRLELNDGTRLMFRWEKRANRDLEAAKLLVDALGPAVDVRAA